MLSMWPYKNYFSHPSFGYLLFSNLTHKTKIKNANMWETTNSKPPGPIIMVAWSETRKQQPAVSSSRSQSDHICLDSLFGRRFALLCGFQPQQTVQKNAGTKPFCWVNWHVLTFLHPILTCSVTNSAAAEFALTPSIQSLWSRIFKN